MPEPVTPEDLHDAIARSSPAVQERLRLGAFEPDKLLRWAAELSSDRDLTNRLGHVEPARRDDLVTLPEHDARVIAQLTALGEDALRRGEVALLVLAGGMATRMGGVVKALVEALPGKTFLQLRLGEKASLEERYGRPFPLWLMTSEATEPGIREALGDKIDGEHLALFLQNHSLRLDPEGGLFHEDSGDLSVYPTGHGDVPDALRRSGLLSAFQKRGGKYLWIANLDNLGATIDPALLGAHILDDKELSIEVVDKAGDKGGVPVRYKGRPVICEDFRLPKDFDPTRVDVFNTNTFLVNVEALASYAGSWTYCVVEKQVDGRPAIQRERLLGELSFNLPTRFLHVPREGERTRFLPVKEQIDLEQRQDDIQMVASQRGMLRE